MIEVFVLKYIIENYLDDGCYKECIEMFNDEIEFKKRHTELQDQWDVKDIKTYSGSIPQILLK
jgi:hypothetical protein